MAKIIENILWIAGTITGMWLVIKWAHRKPKAKIVKFDLDEHEKHIS